MLKKLNELHLINFLSALLIGIAVGLPHSPLRIPLSLLFVLFSPGYALIAALYPRREDLSTAERVALSLGTSLAIVALIGLGLNFLPWGVRLIPILVSLAGFTAICSALAARASGHLPPTERFTIEIQSLLGYLRTVSWGPAAVAGVIITASALVGWRLYTANPHTGETFTEFYVLNDSGKAEAYPDWIAASKPAEVILGIINKEMRRATYTITIRTQGRPGITLGPFPLGNGEKWEKKVQISLPQPGAHREIEFLLFKDNSSASYRRLHLWINVLPGSRTFQLRPQKV